MAPGVVHVRRRSLAKVVSLFLRSGFLLFPRKAAARPVRSGSGPVSASARFCSCATGTWSTASAGALAGAVVAMIGSRIDGVVCSPSFVVAPSCAAQFGEGTLCRLLRGTHRSVQDQMSIRARCWRN